MMLTPEATEANAAKFFAKDMRADVWYEPTAAYIREIHCSGSSSANATTSFTVALTPPPNMEFRF